MPRKRLSLAIPGYVVPLEAAKIMKSTAGIKTQTYAFFFGNMYREDDGSQSHLFSDLYNLIVYLFQPQNMSPVATHMHILPVKLKCL